MALTREKRIDEVRLILGEMGYKLTERGRKFLMGELDEVDVKVKEDVYGAEIDTFSVEVTGDDVLYLKGLNDRFACMTATDMSNLDIDVEVVLWFGRFVQGVEAEWLKRGGFSDG